MARAEKDVLQSLAAINTDFFPRNPKILPYRVIDDNEHRPLVVMEYGYYVDEGEQKRILRLGDVVPNGDDLTSVVRCPLPEFWRCENLSSWIMDLCAAVRMMHKQGIVHRDLKPGNILLKRGAGMERAIPFVLDFNTSVRTESLNESGGTNRYLPPEVRIGKRKAASPADDLYALAVIIWELYFGLGSNFVAETAQHGFLEAPPSSAVVDLLLTALASDAAARPGSAEDFYRAMEAAIRTTSDVAKSNAPGFDELAWAHQAIDGIRTAVIEALAGDDELPVPKDLRERVVTAYSFLTNDDTRTSDLKHDLVCLGPHAISAILEEAYKVHPPQRPSRGRIRTSESISVGFSRTHHAPP